jgi:arylsulfatase A-like enzyme
MQEFRMKSRRQFLEIGLCAGAGALLPIDAGAVPQTTSARGEKPAKRPNIIFVLADDMGFSDIGCYGSEIETPHLDSLASDGLRFTDFHNNPRCCPSRASLLTGLYPHQAGMGMMTADHGRYPYPSYDGDLSQHCVTVAEALKAGGYTTLMAGKWHLTPLGVGEDKHNWPLQRGFDRYYGILQGAASYFDPDTLTLDNEPIEVSKEDKNFYLTDAIGDYSAKFIDEASRKEKPFFLYAAFTAGHWPLMARADKISKYKGRYAAGWDATRKARHQKQLAMGLVKEEWGLTERDPRVPAWEVASYHEWEQRRMEVYAAQIDSLDENIGKIVAKLKDLGIFENTLICFMSDNGGNYEEFERTAPGAHKNPSAPRATRYGELLTMGNDPELIPGGATVYASYGIPWGNVSNTPFRMYKHYAHEGGIATPFLMHWPRGLKTKGLAHAVGHEIDVMPTCLEVAGVTYPPTTKAGTQSPPLEGKSLMPAMRGDAIPDRVLCWEHEGNCAVREGKWKLVSRFPDAWELYDMDHDRTERHNLVEEQPARVRKMAADYAAWASRVGAKTWPIPGTPAGAIHDGTMIVPTYLRRDRP